MCYKLIGVNEGKNMTQTLSSDLLRGNTDAIVLSTITKKPKYGFEIFNSIKEKTNNKYELKEATLYSSYKRLEKDGFVESFWGDETQGARRRYYKITKNGLKNYQAALKEWGNTQKVITQLMEEK